MRSNLGIYVEDARRGKNLSRQVLAGRIGYKNLNKGARRIEQLEQQGAVDENLMHKIITELELDPTEIEAKIELDRKAFQSFLDEPVPMQMTVRHMAAVYSSHPLPEEIKTPGQAKAYASDYAVKYHLKVCLILSRRFSYWIDESGSGVMTETAFDNRMNAPFSSINGKPFLFSSLISPEVPGPSSKE
jgi:hypothetical protein